MAEQKEFYGEYKFNMDSKGRVTLPARYRDMLGEGFCVTKGYDDCLSIYDSENWARFSARLRAYPSTSKAARFVQRTFLSGVSNPEPDKQGKILISLSHREYAHLSKEVIIMGVGDHIEIWDQETWDKYSNGGAMSLEEAAEELSKLEQGNVSI